MKENRTYIGLILILVLSALVSCEKEVSVSEPMPPERLGHLYVDSYPSGARIFIDNKNTGFVTPDTLPFLELREQQLVLKKELWKDYEKVILPSDEEVVAHEADFRTVPGAEGSVEISANVDELKIFVDGQELNILPPFDLGNLYPGEYFIKGAKDSHRSDSTFFTISSGNQSKVTLTLIDTSVWVNYNKENSILPTNHLTDIEVDKNGDVWLASFSGLMKFDKKNFTFYKTDNSPLPQNQINCLLKDSRGSLWIGTSFGLVKKTGSNWETYTTSNSDLTGDYISCIKEAPDGAMWIGTKDGITKIDGSNWVKHTTENGLPTNWILSIGINKFNNVIAGINGKGLYEWVERGWLQVEEDEWIPVENMWLPYIVIPDLPDYNFPSESVTHIVADQDASYWCIFMPDNSLDPSVLMSLNHYTGDVTLLDVLSQPYYFESLYIDENNSKWIGAANGIIVYDENDEKSHIGVNDGLMRATITGITKDANGTYWMATSDKGLIKYKKQLVD